jgi:hypothetical protein
MFAPSAEHVLMFAQVALLASKKVVFLQKMCIFEGLR